MWLLHVNSQTKVIMICLHKFFIENFPDESKVARDKFFFLEQADFMLWWKLEFEGEIVLEIDDKEHVDAAIVVMLNFHIETNILSQKRESHEKIKLMWWIQWHVWKFAAFMLSSK